MQEISLSVDLLAASRRSETLRNVPEEQMKRDVANYLRFLKLVQIHGGPLAPTREIDQVWHLHMLHSVAYQQDCMRLFGRTLDHDGGFGSVPEELPILGKVFERTARLWKERFGESYVAGCEDAMEKCWHDCQSRCWHACSSESRAPVE